MFETISHEISDGILVVTLNRPEKLNAFTVTMANELIRTFREVNRDDEVRAIVVTGAGRAFCAGMDLSVEASNPFGLNHDLEPTYVDMRHRLDAPEIADGVRDTGGKVALAIYDCLKPVIGAINGAAVGIGTTMTLPMDFRFASTEASFGLVFGRIGIMQEACSSWFLPRIVGIEQALEWTLSARIFNAHEAQTAGLVRAVCPPETLLEEACTFARSLTQDRSPLALGLARRTFYRASGAATPMEAHRLESLGVFYSSQRDGTEGVCAFVEKRPAKFSDPASRLLSDFPWIRDVGQSEPY